MGRWLQLAPGWFLPQRPWGPGREEMYHPPFSLAQGQQVDGDPGKSFVQDPSPEIPRWLMLPSLGAPGSRRKPSFCSLEGPPFPVDVGVNPFGPLGFPDSRWGVRTTCRGLVRTSSSSRRLWHSAQRNQEV